MTRLEVLGIRQCSESDISDLVLPLRGSLRRLEIFGGVEKRLEKFFAECTEVKELRIEGPDSPVIGTKFPFIEHLELSDFGDPVFSFSSSLTSLDLSDTPLDIDVPLESVSRQLRFLGIWFRPECASAPLQETCEAFIEGDMPWPSLEVLLTKIGRNQDDVDEDDPKFSLDTVSHLCPLYEALPVLRVWSVTMAERVLCAPENIRSAMKQAFQHKAVIVEDTNGPESLRELRACVHGTPRLFYYPL